jgi:homoserine acetyltransferase
MCSKRFQARPRLDGCRAETPRCSSWPSWTIFVRFHYRTLGVLAPERRNAVLMLHGTSGASRQFLQPSTADFLFAEGQPLDVSKYFIIMPDAIGHGGSSKPSDGLETAFPRYCYSDIVEAHTVPDFKFAEGGTLDD